MSRKPSSKSTIEVKGMPITILKDQTGDYISLTDMLRVKDGDFFISDWLRNRNTIEFLGIWESVFNLNFNYGEFAVIRSQAGLNSYKVSVKEWVDKTHAIGLRATTGRYGGTYAREADLLNRAPFGKTAKQWRDAHPVAEGNIRDHATLEQLVVLSNLESMNSLLIRQGLAPADRLHTLNQTAIAQMKNLLRSSIARLFAEPLQTRAAS